jgi:MOSC domain-containing protein YiiM
MTIGTVRAVFAAPAETDSFVTAPAGALTLDLGGIPGDRHHGPTRPAGPREPWMPKGLAIRNDRQLSALSVEELALIAEAMGIDRTAPELVGANLVIEGIANLSRIAPGAHLAFGGTWGGKGKFDGEVILKVEAYNRPCRGPGRKLAAAHGRPDLEFAFPKAAASLRGLVLSVMAPGTIRPGDAVVVIDPLVAG